MIARDRQIWHKVMKFVHSFVNNSPICHNFDTFMDNQFNGISKNYSLKDWFYSLNGLNARKPHSWTKWLKIVGALFYSILNNLLICVLFRLFQTSIDSQFNRIFEDSILPWIDNLIRLDGVKVHLNEFELIEDELANF